MHGQQGESRADVKLVVGALCAYPCTVCLWVQALEEYGALIIVLGLEVAWTLRRDVRKDGPALYQSSYSVHRSHGAHAMVITGEWGPEDTMYHDNDNPQGEPIPFYRLRNSWGRWLVSYASHDGQMCFCGHYPHRKSCDLLAFLGRFPCSPRPESCPYIPCLRWCNVTLTQSAWQWRLKLTPQINQLLHARRQMWTCQNQNCRGVNHLLGSWTCTCHQLELTVPCSCEIYSRCIG